jgi:hypothetical protein
MKQKMKLWQAVELVSEIEGLVFQKKNKKDEVTTETAIKGLLNEKLSLKAKYVLRKNLEVLQKEKDNYEKGKAEIAEEHIDKKTEKVINIEEGNKKLKDLGEIEIEVELYQFDLDDVNFEADYHYQFFLKFLIKEENGISEKQQ